MVSFRLDSKRFSNLDPLKWSKINCYLTNIKAKSNLDQMSELNIINISFTFFYVAAVPVSQRSGQSQENSFSMNMNASTEGQLRSRRKAAKMLVAVVVMFALCYFPVYLYNIIR